MRAEEDGEMRMIGLAWPAEKQQSQLEVPNTYAVDRGVSTHVAAVVRVLETMIVQEQQVDVLIAFSVVLLYPLSVYLV